LRLKVELLFFLFLLACVFVASLVFIFCINTESDPVDFFLGVTADGNVTATKKLIDRVEGLTNLVIINNPDVIRNVTSLNEVCHYAKEAGQSFFVFMAHPTYWEYNYDPLIWILESKERYGDYFLGIHLYDEPGGNQLDLGDFRMFDLDTDMPLNYRDAAYTYVYFLYIQIRDFIKTDKLVTSDYGLFWFDYEAGYDSIFCEFGSNRIKELNIPLCRGAAEIHNKTWGVMIAWKYEEPPYIESADELFDDMVTAYQAGAKYITIFNYPEIGAYGLLSEEHFDAIRQFKEYVKKNPQNESSNVHRIAYILPENYGWGLRNPNDKMWGVWEADEKSQMIWEDLNRFVEEYGYDFDILIDSYWTRFFANRYYKTLYFWDGNIHTFE
jgi:hypothetical protein